MLSSPQAPQCRPPRLRRRLPYCLRLRAAIVSRHSTARSQPHLTILLSQQRQQQRQQQLHDAVLVCLYVACLHTSPKRCVAGHATKSTFVSESFSHCTGVAAFSAVAQSQARRLLLSMNAKRVVTLILTSPQRRYDHFLSLEPIPMTKVEWAIVASSPLHFPYASSTSPSSPQGTCALATSGQCNIRQQMSLLPAPRGVSHFQCQTWSVFATATAMPA